MISLEEYGEKENSIDEILKNVGLFVSKKLSRYEFIGASLGISNANERYYNSLFFLSEFPGNCGILIIHEIQKYYPYKEDLLFNIISSCIKIATSLLYGILMITTTKEEFAGWLENNFDFITSNIEFINPHSDNSNFVLVKYIDY